METIAEFFKLDFVSVILGVFIIMSAVIAIFDIIGKFSSIIGKPVKWVKRKNEDHELLIKTVEGLNTLGKRHDESVKQSIRHDKDIKDNLEKLTKICINKEIDDWRWEILDFASALSLKREYSKEQFVHVLSIYEKYEKLLEEYHLTNGQVMTSMEVINDAYKEKLKNGF